MWHPDVLLLSRVPLPLYKSSCSFFNTRAGLMETFLNLPHGGSEEDYTFFCGANAWKSVQFELQSLILTESDDI